MARWALLLMFGTLLFANTAWLEEAIEGSGDDVDYVDGDDENVSNRSITESVIWDGRRATPKMPGRQRIWKAIRREVIDMKNILPTLASNISFMELDVRDMNRNFFSMAGDVRFIKNEVMYIKRQAHVIWENVTDTRRDHKRMNKTLWWILGNVTRVIEDVDKTSMAITSMGTSFGTLSVELEKAVGQAVEVQTMSSDFQNMRSEVSQIKTNIEYRSTKMTEEMDAIRDMVSHLSHDIVGIKESFAEGFSNVDYYVNTVQSRILANVSAIDLKVRNYGGLLNSITDNVANIGSSLAAFSGRINDVWDLTRNIGGHMDQFDTRILKVGDQMTGVYDNVGQVNAMISNVGYKVKDVGRQISEMEHHMGAVGNQFVGFFGSVNDNFIKVNVHLEDVHDRIISNVSSVRGDLDEMKVQLRDIRQVIADKCEGACPNGQPTIGNGHDQVTVTTAKPDVKPLDYPSNGIPPTTPTNGYPSNGADVQNGGDSQTEPGLPPNGHPPTHPPTPYPYPPPSSSTYPSTTMPVYPYPPTSTSPYPPAFIPTTTFMPTPMPVYPHPSVPTSPYPPVYPPTSTYAPTTMPGYPYPSTTTSPYPPVHLPTTTYSPIPLPGYPPEPPSPAVSQPPNGYPLEYPSNGRPPVPPHVPTTAAPIPPGYPNGYPSDYPSNGQPSLPPYLPTTTSPLPPGYPNGHPPDYPSNGQPPAPPYLPTTASPLSPGYPNGYPPDYPSNGQPTVPPYLPTTASPLLPGYPNGYPPDYPSNGQPSVPPYLPTTASPPPPGYPTGYPPDYPSNGQPTVPPYLPTTASPLPPGYPNGYPSEYPSNGQPPYLPTTASPLPPGYPNGHPPEHPANGQPPVPPYLPTTASPIPPGYPNGYPPEYPSNGLPAVPPYLPTTASPPAPAPYPPQPVPLPPTDYPHPSVPQIQPPVHPRPTIPVIYPPSYPDVPSGSEPLPIGIPQGPDGPGLPIGCGDEFTGYCACLCPCDCTCPVFNPSQSSIQRTIYERFPYMRQKCQCLCSCRCRSSAIFEDRPMIPSLHPPSAETHTDVPIFQPPPAPNIPWTTHSPLIDNGESPTPVVSSPRPASPATTTEFEEPSSTTEEPVETDYYEAPSDCCTQLREYFADEISWVLEAFGFELDHKMRRLQEELYTIFDGVLRFHVDVSDLAADMKNQLSLAAANIVGALNAITSKVQSLSGYDGSLDNAWFVSGANDDPLSLHRPIGQRPAVNQPEFISPSQLPSYFPNIPNTRPQGRPQLGISELPPNRPISRPQSPPGRPNERPNINVPQARPSQHPSGRPQGGLPARPQGGLPARPQGGLPARPQGGLPARPQGGLPARPQGGLPARPQGGLPARPQGGLPTRPPETPLGRPQGGPPPRPHQRPARPHERPTGRPQYPGQSSPQSSERPPRRPSEFGQSNLVNPPSKPNILWTQSRKFDNETITTTTELSQYLSEARRYFSIGDNSEKGSTIANTSFVKSKTKKKKKKKKNKVCINRRKEIGLESDLPSSTEVSDKEQALANVGDEMDYEDYDDSGHEGDSYDVTVAPEEPIETPATEMAIPDEGAAMIETPIDQFNFHKMLQEHINKQMMQALQPGPGYRPKGKRFPLSPWRGRARNRYKLRPRPLIPMMPGFPFIPPPMGFRPPIPPIGIPIPRIPIPNPLAIRPPPMPDIFGSLPPGAMIAGTNGSPYSVSYNDGKGNSWNVNVNRRNYRVPSGTEADERTASEDELEPEDEDVQQGTEKEVDEQENGREERNEDNDSDVDETDHTTEHEETNEESR